MKLKQTAPSPLTAPDTSGSTSPYPITANDKLLTTKQVSEMIGKSESWLVRKRWEGNGIPYRKIGRHVRYQQSVVLSWVNMQPTMASTSGEL